MIMLMTSCRAFPRAENVSAFMHIKNIYGKQQILVLALRIKEQWILYWAAIIHQYSAIIQGEILPLCPLIFNSIDENAMQSYGAFCSEHGKCVVAWCKPLEIMGFIMLSQVPKCSFCSDCAITITPSTYMCSPQLTTTHSGLIYRSCQMALWEM